jgi:hypothetical protein
MDPETNAQVYGTRLRSGIFIGPNYTWGAYLLVGGNGKNTQYQNDAGVASVVTTNGNLHLDSASGLSTYVNYYDGETTYFCNGANTIIAEINKNGSMYASGFVDRDNTAYYLDPASSSLGLVMNGNIECYARSAAWAEGIRVRVPTTSTWGGIRFTRDRGNYDGNWAIGFTGIDSSDDLTFWANNGGSEAMRMRMTKAGDMTLYGSLYATSEVYAYYSDARLKNFIKPIDNAIDKVKKLTGYYYTENEVAKSLGFNNDKIQVGVSAQDVLEVLPEVVAPAPIDNTYYTVKYEKMIPLLIEAIKEQQSEIDSLKVLLGERK